MNGCFNYNWDSSEDSINNLLNEFEFERVETYMDEGFCDWDYYTTHTPQYHTCKLQIKQNNLDPIIYNLSPLMDGHFEITESSNIWDTVYKYFIQFCGNIDMSSYNMMCNNKQFGIAQYEVAHYPGGYPSCFRIGKWVNGENIIDGYRVKNSTYDGGIGWSINGDYCDKTHKERVVNFEMYCNQNTALKIVSIKEDPICVYTFHLDSRFACTMDDTKSATIGDEEPKTVQKMIE